MRDDEKTDVNAKDGNGMTALQYAIIKEYSKLIAKLLAFENIEVNSQDGGGMTALHYAVLQGSTRAVKALLAHEGIDTEVKDGQGRTPLELANELEYKEIVQSLAVNPKGKLATLWGRLKQSD
jgi:ankyrin repeat protein